MQLLADPLGLQRVLAAESGSSSLEGPSTRSSLVKTTAEAVQAFVGQHGHQCVHAIVGLEFHCSSRLPA